MKSESMGRFICLGDLEGEVNKYERYDNNAGDDRDTFISGTGNIVRASRI